MARPKHSHPTPAELETLNLLWEHGPLTVREVMELTSKNSRGYTTVMSLMNVMFEKGLLTRKQEGRAFRYSAKAKQERTLRKMLRDLLGRAFDGSSSALVAHLLECSSPDLEELKAIREAIEDYERREGIDQDGN